LQFAHYVQLIQQLEINAKIGCQTAKVTIKALKILSQLIFAY